MARRPRPRLVKLAPPVGDEQMANTLLFLLEHVRSGKIHAFSICLIGERPDGVKFSIESATADGDALAELHLLGIMRMAEHNLVMRRQERIDGEIDD